MKIDSNLANISLKELLPKIMEELDNFGISRDTTIIHGSIVTANSRANSDIDLLILTDKLKTHKKCMHISNTGRVFDINLFNPDLLKHFVVAQRRRGMRTLSAMLVEGKIIEGGKNITELMELAEKIYHGSPDLFPNTIYSGRLCTIFSKISSAIGNPEIYPLISEAVMLLAAARLWSTGKWINAGQFLLRELKHQDNSFYESIIPAYSSDLRELNCQNLQRIAIEIFERYGGLKQHSHESAFSEN